ncbi:MAG: hypothetical protein FWE27_03355 [Defluviitaleaceae bacterium]|nr:hypothetical protein [Defluviitaleaceae bacterium]
MIWGDNINDLGMKAFYAEGDYSPDYPPGYLYILALLSKLRRMTGLYGWHPIPQLIGMFPLFISDILSALGIYKLSKHYKPDCQYLGLILAAVYLFSPPVIMDSALWGQTDTVLSAILIWSFYFLIKRREFLSAFLFTVALLTKPQAALFTPVYIFYICDCAFLATVKKEAVLILRPLAALATSIVLFFVICIPFASDGNPFYIIDLYLSTMTRYRMASLGAFNLHGLFGGVGAPIDKPLYYLTHAKWSEIFIVLSVIASGLTFFLNKYRRKNFSGGEHIVLSALVLYTSVYTLATAMHERYLFPSVILSLAFVAAIDKKQYFKLFCVISAVNYACISLSLAGYYLPEFNQDAHSFIPVFSAIIICTLGWLIKEALFFNGKNL